VNEVWTQVLGYNWDNYGVWSTSVQAAYACATDYGDTGSTIYNYPYPVSNLGSTVAQRNNTDACDAAYYAGSGQRRDVLGYSSLKLALSDKWTWKTTLYGHGNDGIGLWFMPNAEGGSTFYTYGTALTGSPVVMRSSEYGIQRGGLLTSLAYETGKNKVEFGGWFEKENFNLARRFYATSASSPVYALRRFPTAPMYTQWAYNFDIDVYQIHAQDVYRINDKLTLAAGFKTIYTNDDGEIRAYDQGSYNGVSLNGLNGYTAASFAQGSLSAGKPFLPQFGVNYKLDQRNEVFADAAYNVRTYQAGGWGFNNAPWGAKSQAAFNSLKSTLKPETSWTEEAGYRYTGHTVAAEASYFHVNYFDRLLAYANGSGISGNPSTLNNVGSVVTNGVDGSINTRINPEWTLYNAVTWNKSTYQDDPMLASGKCVYTLSSGACDSIIGKLVVDTPDFLYKNSLAYSKHGLFGKIGSDYMSTRYFTYSNDGSVGGRFLTEFSAGYSREDLGAFKNVKAQFNISNLANAQYYASIGTNGFIMHDPQSVNNNTLQVGAPRAISGMLSVNF
jgi:iron complex outermembrane receptor protein